MQPSSDSFLRRFDRSGFLLLVVRIVLGATFVWMGANKIAEPIVFLKGVRLYGVLPETPGIYLNLTAIVLPWIEVVAGAALLLGVQIRGAALAIAVMLCVFTPAVLLRALEYMHDKGQSFFEVAFDCGCGTGVEIIWQKMIKNITLCLLAVIALFSQSRRFCGAMWFERRKSESSYCHFCGYAAASRRAGLCPACATPPVIPDQPM